MGRLSSTDLDAVTIDVFGTMVGLIDPAPKLAEVLRARGVTRSPAEIAAAVEAETAFYGPRSHEGSALDEGSAGVFLEALGADLPAREFAAEYVGTLEFELLPGTLESLRALRSRGLDLAVAANWEAASVHDQLAEHGLAPFFSHVVTANEVGVRKPDPAVLRRALELLRVAPERALHVGDDEVDEQAARAVGMRFARAPLERALAELW